MPRREHRVVITGVGLVTPLGTGTQKNWDALLAGRSGITTIERFEHADFPVHFAGEVRDFDPATFIEKKDIKKVDPFCQYAIAAAQLAVDDAGFVVDPATSDRTGVIIGIGMGGIDTIETTMKSFLENRLKRISPFFIPRLISNLAPGQISIRFGCRGPNYVTTSACASGGHAVGEAFRLIRFGYQDAMITGGSEAAVTALGVGGFAIMRALSTRNEAPEKASRPFEKNRDGFVIGEGAGILILESLERAQSRGARVYAELIGYGTNADAHHITSPAPGGEGAARCMKLAIDDAEIAITDVGYINAHGTSTPYNDANETLAIKKAFGDHASKLAVSSTKSMTGHLLGAAGGIEAVYTALTLQTGMIPPTINYEEPDPECDLDYVPNLARSADIDVALSNSFGFGGTNVCLAFRRFNG